MADVIDRATLESRNLILERGEYVGAVGVRDVVAAATLAERKDHQDESRLAVALLRVAIENLIQRVREVVHHLAVFARDRRVTDAARVAAHG